MRRVVDGFEEALELTRRSTVDNQDEGDSDRDDLGGVRGFLVPLHVHTGLTCTEVVKRKINLQNSCLTRLVWSQLEKVFGWSLAPCLHLRPSVKTPSERDCLS